MNFLPHLINHALTGLCWSEPLFWMCFAGDQKLAQRAADGHQAWGGDGDVWWWHGGHSRQQGLRGLRYHMHTLDESVRVRDSRCPEDESQRAFQTSDGQVWRLHEWQRVSHEYLLNKKTPKCTTLLDWLDGRKVLMPTSGSQKEEPAPPSLPISHLKSTVITWDPCMVKKNKKHCRSDLHVMLALFPLAF